MTPACTHLARVLAPIALLAVAGNAAAERTPATVMETISLSQVVAATLRHNSDLRLAGAEVERARGSMLAAAAPFDSAIGLLAGGSQAYQFTAPPEPQASYAVRQLSVAASWNRRLRNGLSIGPEVTATKTTIDVAQPIELTEASVRLKLSAPLLRDFGGVISEAPELAARAGHAAASMDEQHARAQVVLQSAIAYWDYLAAERRLAVSSASEGRAQRTAELTAALVQGDERTRADLTQAEAHVASRRALRIATEQGLLAAWQQLAVVMGTRPLPLGALPRAATDFPAGELAAAWGPGSSWIERTTARRPDLAAAQRRVDAAEVLLQAARDEQKPALDLELSAGYSGQQRGAGLQRVDDPFYKDIPGIDATVQLRLELPIERTGARGRLAESAAVREREQLVEAEIERRIRVAVPIAIESLKRSRSALAESEHAVELFRLSVEHENRRFQAGTSTLLSVIQAEELLTSALLDEIEGQRAFAVGMASLRFETSTIFSDSFGREGANDPNASIAVRLTSLP
jgi:outer membrane protein